MKIFSLLSVLTVCLVALPFALAEEGVHGVMMVVKGDIKVTEAKTSKTEPAKVGRKIFAGDTITAGPDSRAKIVMSDKNVLNISPDSKLVIEKYTNDGTDKNVELKVEYGKIRASVEQKYDGEKSKFNVKTPSAVAGVRGTDFLTGYNAATRESKVITFSGTVAVGKPGPGGSIMNPVFVKPGQMTTSSEGKAPDAPKAVPAEELNKAKQETVAEKQDQPKGDKAAVADKAADKDKDKEKDKGEKGDKAAADKPEGKPDKSDSKDGDKKSADGKDKPNGDKMADKGDKKGPPSGEGERQPASLPGSPSMIGSSDLGPELGRDINIGAPPPPAVLNNFNPTGPIVTQPPPNSFINDAISGSQKSKTTIIITK